MKDGFLVHAAPFSLSGVFTQLCQPDKDIKPP